MDIKILIAMRIDGHIAQKLMVNFLIGYQYNMNEIISNIFNEDCFEIYLFVRLFSREK